MLTNEAESSWSGKWGEEKKRRNGRVCVVIMCREHTYASSHLNENFVPLIWLDMGIGGT
jgi:hypothetical protein